MYKEEFPNIFILFRFLDDISQANIERRKKSLAKSYRPNPVRRSLRWTKNTLNTVRDSVTEALGTALAQGKALNPALNAMSYQHKYVTKVQSEAMGMWNGSFDPILERHIGLRVVMEVTSPSGVVVEHVGVFKEYSQQFLEVMDINYMDNGKLRVCDMVVPRAHAQIRHSAEPVKDGTTIVSLLSDIVSR
ncbi:MAG: hypothetical protein FJ319_14125 [SAR202 cluster bacterium]|nr:hypothetical protein [SAR202 cluster bacterium]